MHPMHLQQISLIIYALDKPIALSKIKGII